MNRVMTGRLAKIAGITHLEVQTVLELVSRTYNWEAMGESTNDSGHPGEPQTVGAGPSMARVAVGSRGSLTDDK
jgi:hypothetical protein